MFKKWRLLTALLLVLAIVTTIGVLILLPPTPGVTFANYSRIEVGMTREQVIGFLGEPQVNEVAVNAGFSIAVWNSGQEIEIEVQFDKEGRVEACAWNHRIDMRSSWEKLRDRLPFIAKGPPHLVRK